MSEPAFAHGGPPLQGCLRATAEDFEVEEVLGFEPDGSGEHVYLRIEKRLANTEWVARQLAHAASVPLMSVGFSGLKDRHALTRQTFSVHLPGREGPDWTALGLEGVRVLSVSRHSRKLKRGVHRTNRFRIRLTDLQGSRREALACLDRIALQGVPNYFGEQRFGHDNGNLRAATALFAGQRMGRSQRGFALSAARASIFNGVLSERVAEGSWNRALDGDVWMLGGTHSIFGPQALDQALQQRLQSFDIHPTGPLWGKGPLRSTGKVAEIERDVAMASGFAAGLEAAELRQERRSLRLRPDLFDPKWESDNALWLAFSLPSGCFATSVIREVCATSSRVNMPGS
ncbi:tRNA pseudouridine(13) synthase TruD [Dokdonella sp.]|uniref:tRNA pseudouridine(13) synthase TruD n=1 Tax=Dokdonella sp. TaxID=2291710 RepID=UPI0035292DB6